MIFFFPLIKRPLGRPLVLDRLKSVILMRDGKVVDTTPDAAADRIDVDFMGGDWRFLSSVFKSRFPEFPEVQPDQQITLQAQDDEETCLEIRPEGNCLRLVLYAPAAGAASQHSANLLSDRHTRLRGITDASPNPIWLTDENGQVKWSNPAYGEVSEVLRKPGDTRCVFGIRLSPEEQTCSSRVSLDNANRERQWFEVISRRTPQGIAHFASSIEALIEAENAQRNFVQTLTKTFAHLPIGLAIFDCDHRLVLFNPSLLDLTGLSVEFLSARPSLTGFFDQLREARILPEPKNYADWRDGLAEVIAAARNDRYSETWNLPSGLTYSVVGRPHPDGALAFLIEDISAEISLTRRFRAELSLSQSVFDCFEDAVVVFDSLGVLSFCNEAYKTLWNHDPETAIAETTIVDATQLWRQSCEPTLVWSEIRDFILAMNERATWDTRMRKCDGTPIVCVLDPLPSGATLIRFEKSGPAVPKETGNQAVVLTGT